MIYEKAYAKVNLVLDVKSKRSDGYHDLKMIMLPLDLHDELSFEIDDEIKLESNIFIKDNQVIRTAKLIKDRYQVKDGAKITLNKQIPIGGGLAGGSADIAATIRGLNQLWKLSLSDQEMADIALELGSDTLFCLYNKPAYVSGRGEHIIFLGDPLEKEILLICPPIEVSTKKVFKNHEIEENKHAFDQLLSAYQHQEWLYVYDNLYNDLTKTTFKVYPKLKGIFNALKQIEPTIMMSGSGSTLFLLKSKIKSDQIIEKASNMGLKTIKTRIKT